MENWIFQNDRIRLEQRQYRVIQILHGKVLLIELGIKKTRYQEIFLSDLLQKLERKEAQLLGEEEDEKAVVLFGEYQGRSRDIRERYERLRKELEQYAGGDYDWLLHTSRRSAFIHDFAAQCNVSDTTIRRMLRKYLQAGMDLSQLGAGV